MSRAENNAHIRDSAARFLVALRLALSLSSDHPAGSTGESTPEHVGSTVAGARSVTNLVWSTDLPLLPRASSRGETNRSAPPRRPDRLAGV